MLERVRVRNYRSLADIDVSMEPLTVLVGPNASGKSNLVDVFRFIRDALRRGLDTAIIDRGGLPRIRRWSRWRPYKSIEIVLEGTTGGNLWVYEMEIGARSLENHYIVREVCTVRKRDGGTVELETRDGKWVKPADGPSMPVLGSDTLALRLLAALPEFGGVFRFLANSGFYTIFPDALREPHKHTFDYPLDEHGYNLASVLRSMENKRSAYLPDLQRALAKVVAGVSGFRVRHAGGYLVIELKHESPGEQPHHFEAAQESDGTLRMLGLLVALFQTPTLPFLAVEEPELTIHPGAMGVLCDILEERSARGQILLTTHSPDLVSRFHYRQLRVVEREGGVTTIGPVSSTQVQAISERLFSAGELMRMEGLRQSKLGDRHGEHCADR